MINECEKDLKDYLSGRKRLFKKKINQEGLQKKKETVLVRFSLPMSMHSVAVLLCPMCLTHPVQSVESWSTQPAGPKELLSPPLLDI